MAERRGHPVVAAVMGLVTLALAAAGGLLAYLTAAYGGADYWRIANLVSSVGTIALLVIGGWAVVRLAQGRRVGAVAAVFVGLVTGAGVFVCSVVWLWAIGMTEGDSGRPVPVGEKAFGWFVIAALLIGGLWCAWRIGSGRWGLRRKPKLDSPAEPLSPDFGVGSTVAAMVARRRPAAEPGPFASVAGRRWRLKEPGGWLRPSKGAEGSMWLAGGTGVVEWERKAGMIHVTLPNGETGWLDRRQVRPPEEPPSPAG